MPRLLFLHRCFYWEMRVPRDRAEPIKAGSLKVHKQTLTAFGSRHSLNNQGTQLVLLAQPVVVGRPPTKVFPAMSLIDSPNLNLFTLSVLCQPSELSFMSTTLFARSDDFKGLCDIFLILVRYRRRFLSFEGGFWGYYNISHSLKKNVVCPTCVSYA